MRYIIYARKSTEDEDRQILSIEAQLVELREFAAKEKLEIVASFQEAKRSYLSQIGASRKICVVISVRKSP